MDLSRRQFLQLSTGAGAGTAVGTLVGLMVNLTPATTRAQHLRIQGTKTTPSVSLIAQWGAPHWCIRLMASRPFQHWLAHGAPSDDAP